MISCVYLIASKTLLIIFVLWVTKILSNTMILIPFFCLFFIYIQWDDENHVRMKAKKWQLIQLKIWNVSNVYARWVNIFFIYNFNNCDWFNGNFKMKKNIIYIIDWNKRCAGRLDSSSYLKCTNNIWVNYPIEIITQRGGKKIIVILSQRSIHIYHQAKQ